LEGTGSLLKVQQDGDELNVTNDVDKLTVKNRSIRYFSPKEIANLHCFPNDFGKFFYYTKIYLPE
jgi:hypothetical protein